MQLSGSLLFEMQLPGFQLPKGLTKETFPGCVISGDGVFRSAWGWLSRRKNCQPTHPIWEGFFSEALLMHLRKEASFRCGRSVPSLGELRPDLWLSLLRIWPQHSGVFCGTRVREGEGPQSFTSATEIWVHLSSPPSALFLAGNSVRCRKEHFKCMPT